MDIGKLRHRVDLLEFFEKRDEYGGVIGEWRVVERLWADVRPISGNEYYLTQQVTAECTTSITVRYNPRILVTHRIKYNGTLYEIVSVIDENTLHKSMILNCKEVIDGEELFRKAKENKSGCGRCGADCETSESYGECCECSIDERG